MTPLSLAPPQDLVASDENLAGHEEHLKYRYQQFLATKDAIDQNEGGLLEFSKVWKGALGSCFLFFLRVMKLQVA